MPGGIEREMWDNGGEMVRKGYRKGVEGVQKECRKGAEGVLRAARNEIAEKSLTPMQLFWGRMY